MYRRSKIIFGISSVALSILITCHAPGQVQNTVAISSVLVVQSDNYKDNGVISTTTAPKKYSLSTKDLLIALAGAEYLEGNYAHPTFSRGAKPGTCDTARSCDYAHPTFSRGAKLVAEIWESSLGYSIFDGFEVVDQQNQVLVDVSDILSVDLARDYPPHVVHSGRTDNDSGLARPSQKTMVLYTITYDDTGIDGSANLRFSLTGVLTDTITNGAVNSVTNMFMQSQTHQLSNATGDGRFRDNDIVMAANLSFSGKGITGIAAFPGG